MQYHIHMYLYIYIAYVLTFCKGDSSSLLERKYLLRIMLSLDKLQVSTTTTSPTTIAATTMALDLFEL